MAGGYGKGRKVVVKKRPVKRTSGTSSRPRRKLQGMAKAANLAYQVVRDSAAAYGAHKVAQYMTRRSGGGRRKNKRIGKGNEGTGGYSQWSQRYATGKFGKLTPRKIDNLSNDTVTFRHQLIGPFNDYGKRWMWNANLVNGDQYYPLILFELNSANNYSGGTQKYHVPVHQLYQVGGTTTMNWLACNAQNTDGTEPNAHWITERSSHTSTAVSTAPMAKSIHKWSSLDLELWGQTAKPTMYTIYLCQFHEDVLPTSTEYTSNVVQYSSMTTAAQNEFWQSMIKRYVYSPLAKIDDGYGTKKIKIMKQYKVNIDPTASYENDPDPHVKTMKLFYRFNRACNFEWEFNSGGGQSTANMNDADWVQEAGWNRTQVHPNARLFVMVRASNFTKTALASVSNANTPSISWVMRSSYLINS